MTFRPRTPFWLFGAPVYLAVQRWHNWWGTAYKGPIASWLVLRWLGQSSTDSRVCCKTVNLSTKAWSGSWRYWSHVSTFIELPLLEATIDWFDSYFHVKTYPKNSIWNWREWYRQLPQYGKGGTSLGHNWRKIPTWLLGKPSLPQLDACSITNRTRAAPNSHIYSIFYTWGDSLRTSCVFLRVADRSEINGSLKTWTEMFG